MPEFLLLPAKTRSWRLLDVFVILVLAMLIIPLICVWAVKIGYQIRGIEVTLEQLQETTLLPALFLQELALLWLTVASVRRGYGRPLAAIGINRVPPVRTIFSGLLWCESIFCDQVMSEQISFLFFSVFLGQEELAKVLTEETQQITSLFGLGRDPLSLVLLILLFVVLVPLAEEVFFRGFAFQVFKERYGGRGAVFATALLFTLMHGYVVEFLPIFAVGIGLGYITKHFQSIWPGVIGHALINLISVVTGVFFQ